MKDLRAAESIMCFLLALLAVAGTVAPPAEPVHYRLAIEKPGDSTIAVSLTLPNPAAGPVTLIIPRAVPMGYSQQPYDRYVTTVSAHGKEDESLAVERKDGSRWQIGGPGSRVRQVSYRVDLARMERELLSATDSSRARPGYVGVLGYSVFGYFEGWEGRAVRLDVDVPPDWPVFTTLAPVAPPQRGRAAGEAADFYTLADSQVTMGPGLSSDAARRAASPCILSAYSEGTADLPFSGGLIAQAMNALTRLPR